MGLIKAALNAIGGTLEDQYKEYIYCDSMPVDVLAEKGHKKTNGRSTNKGDDNIITDGSAIAVNEGQCALIVVDGKVTEDFPNTIDCNKAKPVLKTMPGWKCDIRGIKEFDDLPEAAKNYVKEIERLVGYPIKFVSNGPGRDDLIRL